MLMLKGCYICERTLGDSGVRLFFFFGLHPLEGLEGCECARYAVSDHWEGTDCEVGQGAVVKAPSRGAHTVVRQWVKVIGLHYVYHEIEGLQMVGSAYVA
jgi:hypothetical protein